MIKVLLLLILNLLPYCLKAENYSMKSIGENIFKSITINDEKLTIIENSFTWTDSLANYGTGFCVGSSINGKNNITLNNFCEFQDSLNNKFYSKVQRVSSELKTGLGTQKFIKASEKYKFLLDKQCKYAISYFRETNWLTELSCK
jgi:hypothetical protein